MLKTRQTDWSLLKNKHIGRQIKSVSKMCPFWLKPSSNQTVIQVLNFAYTVSPTRHCCQFLKSLSPASFFLFDRMKIINKRVVNDGWKRRRASFMSLLSLAVNPILKRRVEEASYRWLERECVSRRTIFGWQVSFGRSLLFALNCHPTGNDEFVPFKNQMSISNGERQLKQVSNVHTVKKVWIRIPAGVVLCQLTLFVFSQYIMITLFY